MISLMVTISSISGACGESVSIGHGTSVAVSESSSAEGILASDGSVTQSSVSSIGVIDDLNIKPWVMNRYGDYVEIFVQGTNVAGFSYRDNCFPGEGSGWISNAIFAEQWLGASWADSLYAHSFSKNIEGDVAKADITIDHGTLGGYHSSAFAGAALWLDVAHGAFAYQSADYATGNNILINTWAANSKNDRAGSQTEIKTGALDGYSALAEAVGYTDGLKAAGVQVDRMSASAPYGSISQTMVAIDKWGDTSQVSTYIYKGDLNSYPYSSDFPSIACSISDRNWADAVQSVDASSAGSENSLYSYGKSYNTIFGLHSYSQPYSNSRVRFWNSAANRPTLAGEWHGTFG